MSDGRSRFGVVLPVAIGLSALAFLVIVLVPWKLGQREESLVSREAAVRATSLAAALSEPLKKDDPSEAAAVLEDIRAARGTDYAYLVVWDKDKQPIVGVNTSESQAISTGLRFSGGLVHVAVPVPDTTATLQMAIPDERSRHYRDNVLLAGFVALALLLGGAVVAAGGSRLPKALLRDAAAVNARPRTLPAPEPMPASGGGATGDAYLAWMSHELRTPLNAIIGYSEMLEEDAVFLEQNDFIPDLKNIRKAGRHMLSLVDDVVDLSRLHSGDIEVDVTEVEVAEFVEEVVRDVRSLVDRTLGTLDVNVAPTAGTVEVDRSKLGRALGNLLRQVIGLTGQGEMALLVERVGVDGVDMLQFALTHPELDLDASTVKALLSDYTRPDQRALPQYARTGLGLVVTREFAELMGGDLLVQQADPGSSFLLRVPSRVKAR
ncbi:MAG: HAMP domain-containing histidine kinase [Deltaproteobacteria bacterium]|nr:MAG: HAMP domain-containing histidine kinase [Deltaproteobacteria bacterium]